jgi:hypothetical protein
MPVVLDYASPTTHPLFQGRLLSKIPTVVAITSSIAILARSVLLTQSAQLSLLVPTDCGTGRHEAQQAQYSLVFALAIPIAAWLAARYVHTGVIASRCAVLASVIGWFTCFLFVPH